MSRRRCGVRAVGVSCDAIDLRYKRSGVGVLSTVGSSVGSWVISATVSLAPSPSPLQLTLDAWHVSVALWTMVISDCLLTSLCSWIEHTRSLKGLNSVGGSASSCCHGHNNGSGCIQTPAKKARALDTITSIFSIIRVSSWGQTKRCLMPVMACSTASSSKAWLLGPYAVCFCASRFFCKWYRVRDADGRTERQRIGGLAEHWVNEWATNLLDVSLLR